MAQHYVTCVYCKEKFNRDIEPTVAISERRYAHKKCADDFQAKKKQEEKDYEELEKYIKKLFNRPFVTARIQKQIKDYKEQYNYTFSGILKTLEWWYDIRGNSLEKANEGIGIVPFIYDQAKKYYYELFLAQQSSQKIDSISYKVEYIEIAPPQIKKRPPKLFNIEDELEE